MAPRLASLAIGLAIAATAHAESRPHYGGTVDASLLGTPLALDPVLARTHAEITVVDLVFDTLYRVGTDGIVQPRLALALPVLDAARTTAVIALKRGVRFHDGSELTAADVVASFERARAGTARWIVAPMIGLRAQGDALVIALRAPVGDLATLLALPQLAITKGGTVGTGPFVVETRAKGRLALRAFDDYFAGRPYLDQLVLHWYDTPDGEARQFETGAAQLSARGVAAFAGAQPKFRADDVEGPAALLVYAGWGRAHEAITKDARFRHALDLALARGALTTIGAGERIVPTRLPWPVEAGAPVLDAAGKAGDVEAAKKALGGLAVAAKLEILVEITRPDDREIAERVARALDNLGVGAAITALPAEALHERVANGACDLYIDQLAEPVTDVLAWWGGAFAAGGDDYVAAKLGAGALDLAATGKAFADRLPILPLMFRAVRIWHRTDVRGLGFDASGRPDLAALFLHGAPLPSRKP